jgi:Pyruvate/2-oxoacid:ferredoxin oxidoreductase gamma subunit
MGFVVSTTPEDDAENVSRYTNVYIRFDQAMFEADLFRNIKISGTDAEYVMSYDPQTYVLKIDFLEPLKKGSTIKISVKRNVKNSCGQRQRGDVKFDFQIAKK